MARSRLRSRRPRTSCNALRRGTFLPSNLAVRLARRTTRTPLRLVRMAPSRRRTILESSHRDKALRDFFSESPRRTILCDHARGRTSRLCGADPDGFRVLTGLYITVFNDSPADVYAAQSLPTTDGPGGYVGRRGAAANVEPGYEWPRPGDKIRSLRHAVQPPDRATVTYPLWVVRPRPVLRDQVRLL